MSCLIRSGFNVECIKQSKLMPIFKRSLDRSHSSVKKVSKRKIRQVNTTEAMSLVKVKGKDVPEGGAIKHCEMCNETSVGDGSTTETREGMEKQTQTSEQMVRKPYPKISDYLIRNIMSFPIQGPYNHAEEVCETEDSKSSSFPSVTTILSETISTESRRVLEKWKENMIAQVGPEKFLEVQKDPVKKSKSKKNFKRSKKILAATLSRGNRLHNAIKRYLLGTDINDIELDENIEGCWKSVMTALPHISDVKLVETCVHHPHLHYRGIVDCVACYKNVPHVIEWKQSEKAKKKLHQTYDAPIQLCAYMGAISWCKTVNFTKPVTNGLIVVAYVDGSPADIFPLNSECCQRYWEQWLRRVQQFWLIHSPVLKDSLC